MPSVTTTRAPVATQVSVRAKLSYAFWRYSVDNVDLAAQVVREVFGEVIREDVTYAALGAALGVDSATPNAYFSGVDEIDQELNAARTSRLRLRDAAGTAVDVDVMAYWAATHSVPNTAVRSVLVDLVNAEIETGAVVTPTPAPDDGATVLPELPITGEVAKWPQVVMWLGIAAGVGVLAWGVWRK